MLNRIYICSSSGSIALTADAGIDPYQPRLLLEPTEKGQGSLPGDNPGLLAELDQGALLQVFNQKLNVLQI